MNAVGEIFVALALLAGSGYATEKVYIVVERETLIHVHRGLPSLSAYTARLTCSTLERSGRLVPARCSRRATSSASGTSNLSH